MATDVKLVKHHLKNGRISLYLSFYPYFYDRRTGKTIKSENLKLQLIEKPKNNTEKRHNAETEELAFAIQSKRILQIRNEEFGFLDKTKREQSFLDYFKEEASKKHTKWDSCYKHFERFTKGHCTFGDLNVSLCKQFKEYLHRVKNVRTGRPLGHNSIVGYLIVFRTVIKKAYVDKMIETNLNDFFDGENYEKTQKAYLTFDEFKRLADTPCKFDVLRRISVFAVFSALRVSDLERLEWSQISKAPDGQYCIRKTIVKSHRDETVFVSDEALSWCGQRGEGYVFKGFRRSMTREPFQKWLRDAGITKKFTFHCLRHTAATLMISEGVDIYTVSKMLTHKNVQTTQIYADIVDEKKRKAANAISLLK